MPRTLAGSNVMLRAGELNQSEDSYRGSGSLLPGTTTRVDVVLSRFYQAPTAGVHAIRVTFDSDHAYRDKRVVVADLWANTNLWHKPSLYSGPGETPFTNLTAAAYEGFGPIISNIHIEVSCPGFKLSTRGTGP